MTRMNALIPLQVQQPDVVGSMDRGFRAGRRAGLADLYRAHGDGIVSGNQNALTALARFDPQQAMQVQVQQQSMDIQRQQNARAASAENRTQQQFEAQMSEQEASRQLEETLHLLMASETPEQFHQTATAQGLRIDDIDTVRRQWPMRHQYTQLLTLPPQQRLQAAAELERMQAAGPQPRSTIGKQAADLRDGLITQEQFETATRKTPLVQNYIGAEPTDGPAAPQSFPPTTENLPDGAGRSSFGLGGAARNTANAVTDFAFGTEVFPETGEATRYFRDLEENGLVGLAQAYPRQPAAQLMDRLRRLLPNTGTMEGAQAAYRELVQMQSRFERDLKNALRMQGRGSASAQAETARRILALQGLVDQATEGVRLLQPAQSGGTSQDDVNLMNQLLGEN